MFEDRIDAATQLIPRLSTYSDSHPLILAIPRGAVPMGKVLADALGGEMDVVLVRKLGAPGNQEFAIGSVDESGRTFISDYAEKSGADTKYIDEEKTRQLQAIRERRVKYTAVKKPVEVSGRVVIVVDDGLATGSTMISALHALRARQPKSLICAVPVAPTDTLARVARAADEVICLETPTYFSSVGQFYRHFEQVTDDEVINILQQTP